MKVCPAAEKGECRHAEPQYRRPACGKVCAEQVTHIDAEDNREKESDRPACRTATLGDHREQGTEDLKRASGKNSGTPQGKQRRQFVDVEVRPGEVEQPGY